MQCGCVIKNLGKFPRNAPRNLALSQFILASRISSNGVPTCDPGGPVSSIDATLIVCNVFLLKMADLASWKLSPLRYFLPPTYPYFMKIRLP